MDKRIDGIDEKELLDVVDSHDNVVKQIIRDDAFTVLHSTDLFLRVVNCFIINDKGELWIPLRNSNKKLWPNALDFSCGGFVQSGETYEHAMIEELYEELGLPKNMIKVEFLKKLDPIECNIKVFSAVYVLRLNDVPNYNQNDFQSFEWIKPNNLRKKLVEGFSAKSDLLPVLEGVIDFINI